MDVPAAVILFSGIFGVSLVVSSVARLVVSPFLRSGVAATRGPRECREVRVRVKGGYEPDVVLAQVGQPLRLTFHREETAPCSERVVFPAFGKSVTLPRERDVTIELLPERSGEYEFTCQLGVLRGRLVVTGEGTGPLPAERPVGSGTASGQRDEASRKATVKPQDGHHARHGGHARHVLMMIACCVPMVAVLILAALKVI